MTSHAGDDAQETDRLLPGSAEHQLEKSLESRRGTIYWVNISIVALVWQAFGVIYLMIFEKFTFVQAAYVTIQIMTTVGYGDFTSSISRSSTQIFLCFFIIGSLVVIAYVINALMGLIVGGPTDYLRAKLRSIEGIEPPEQSRSISQRTLSALSVPQSVIDYYMTLNELVVATLFCCLFLALGVVFFVTFERCSCQQFGQPIEGCKMSECATTGGHTMSVGSALYMGIVTLSTCGFGDVTPSTNGGMWFAIFWLLLGVAVFANFLGALIHFFVERDRDQTYHLKSKITRQIFDKMDKNGDGTISKSEFRRFVLLKFSLIEESILDEIDEQYKYLEQKCKSVTYEEIIALYNDNEQPPTV